MPQQDPPDGWHWGIGNRSSSYYTHWLYSDRILYPNGNFGYEAEIYWDEGHDHTVCFYEIERLKPDGDPVVADVPCYSSRHETEREALADAVATARELTEEKLVA